MNMAKTVLAYGELLWDILPTETVLGGAPFNFAYRVNSLGHKGFITSRLGKDEIGQKAYNSTVALGMLPTYLQWDDDYPTGTVNVYLDSNGHPDFEIIKKVAYDFIEMTESLQQISSQSNCIYFGTLVQRSEKSRSTLQQLFEYSPDSLKFFDINLRKECYSLDTITYSLDKANILKINKDEALYLADELRLSNGSIPHVGHDLIEKYHLDCCIITLAEEGVFACSRDGEDIYVPGYNVTLADSVGSGDAFSAGFLHQHLLGASTREACQFGNALGALVATQRGATSPVSENEIHRLLTDQIERHINMDLQKFAVQ